MLLAISNLSSSRTVECSPWETETTAPPKTLWNKPDVEHCFYSGLQGVISASRIDSKNNPAMFLHWLVADYDGEIDQNMRDTVLDRCGDFKPQYLCRTASGGARLLWRLEQPLPLCRNDLTAKLLRYINKKLKLCRILVGIDNPAFEDPCKYYEAGTDWVRLSDDLIPAPFMMQWVIESTHNYAWKNFGPVIPIDLIADEVKKQYPGKWQGEFSVGARGLRFWDLAADNETASVVRESGMQCFTGGQAFIPWSAILGGKFVRQFQADQIGGAVSEVYFDGREYWQKLPNGEWQATNKSDMAQDLKVERGLSAATPRGSTASPVDQAMTRIRKQQSIACAAPLIHRPKGLVQIDGRLVLNISIVEMFQPAGKADVDPVRDFPWLHNYFSGYFDPPEQLDYFYAWLKRWYESALEGRMLPGQAAFFAGVPNTGKTLLSNVILSRIFGGHIDASSFLSGEDGFNSHLFTSAVWAVDDVVPLTDNKSHLKFSALVKKMAANRTFSVREKYRVDKLIEWNGRVVVTCNTDPESIRILPDVDLSNRDKINLFRIAERDTFVFPRDVESIIAAELPFFLRWLLGWQPPDKVLGDTRYGVKTYCDDSLFEAARHSSSAYSFLEVLLKFFEGQVEDTWEGSATDLLTAMLIDDDGLAGIASKYTTAKVGRELSKLASQGYAVKQGRRHTTRVWIINMVQLSGRDSDEKTPF
ncbi:hypothetical protein P4B35_14000 [Pontiellaceae bacterium B12227]|nr:hypothetical protein [Pontiellaceae bacterium B12227]